MSITTIGAPTRQQTYRGTRVTGRARFTTTSLTGELPIDSAAAFIRGPIDVRMLKGPTHTMVVPTGTIATSGATSFNIISPYAGIVVSAAVVSGATQAAHSTIVFDWHMINKGAGAAGTAVVIDRATAGNTLDTDVDAAAAALTAFIPRALTVTATAADKTIVAGDVLNFVWTAAGSTPTSQTGTSLLLKISADGSTGDEAIWVDEAALVNTTSGALTPAVNTSLSPVGRSVTVNRWSSNPTSGGIFEYSYEF